MNNKMIYIQAYLYAWAGLNSFVSRPIQEIEAQALLDYLFYKIVTIYRMSIKSRITILALNILTPWLLSPKIWMRILKPVEESKKLLDK